MKTKDNFDAFFIFRATYMANNLPMDLIDSHYHQFLDSKLGEHFKVFVLDNDPEYAQNVALDFCQELSKENSRPDFECVDDITNSNDLMGIVAVENKEGIIGPKFKCCVCGELINEAKNANVNWEMKTDNSESQVWIACKGKCDWFFLRQFADKKWRLAGCHNLELWLHWLLKNTGYDHEQFQKWVENQI
tara:strand:+ start:2232 stop:2801 length:570 start_codon:yes stop_codon:yes gene_type:complete